MGVALSTDNPIDLLFGGMEKLGPGGDAYTRHVLSLLATKRFDVVVDAGCGTGRQTLVLAGELEVLVHAVDSYEPFLKDLARRAEAAGLKGLVETHCMDMKDIPDVFPSIDLLWSEGGAYNIGFKAALTTWMNAIAPGGFAVVSELTWLSDSPPIAVQEFFQSGYPEMQTLDQNLATAERAGYRVLTTFTLPDDAWTEGYYKILQPRANALLDHPDQAVRDFAAETIKEIEAFGQSRGSYAYIFYVLQRPLLGLRRTPGATTKADTERGS